MGKTMKRILALVLAGAMVLSFAACGPKGGKGGSSTGIDGENPLANGGKFEEGTVIKMVTSSHASWPYKEDWVVWDYIEEATGAKLEVNAIPNEDFTTKVNLLLASPDTLPDILSGWSKTDVDAHTSSGAFVPLSDNMDLMPNFSAYLDSVGEDAAEVLVAERTSSDGKMYVAQVVGEVGAGNGKTWMYRKDIFEKNGIKVPTTKEELIDACLKLKELYPNSYPVCFRNGLTQINIMGPMWKPYFEYGFYYDYEAGKWCYGAADSDTMKEIITFFQDMQNKGLVPPDYLTIATSSWQELMTTDRGFIMPEYIVRINFFNNIGRETNPDYTFAAMEPPMGRGKIANHSADGTCVMAFNTGDNKRMANAVSYIDWMISDEAHKLLQHGKEGETYSINPDGTYKQILGENDVWAAKYGLGTVGTYLRTGPVEGMVAEDANSFYNQQVKFANQFKEDYSNPAGWLAFNDEEYAVYEEYADSLRTYTEEMLSKFFLGQESMDNWDEFQAGLEEMGVNELLEIYESAYARASGK